MQNNFDLKQYLLRENKLLNEGIGGYVDIKPMKEEEPEGEQYDGKYDAEYGPAITSELEDHTFGKTDRLFDLFENFEFPLHRLVADILDAGFKSEEVAEFLNYYADRLVSGKIEINEYESSYRLGNDGKCYRVDDEGNRTEVSSAYCKNL